MPSTTSAPAASRNTAITKMALDVPAAWYQP